MMNILFGQNHGLNPAKLNKPTLNTAQVKFGLVELDRDEFDKSEGLYEAALGLAKAGQGEQAAKLLEEAYTGYTAHSMKSTVLKTMAQGVKPGLAPNPDRALKLARKAYEALDTYNKTSFDGDAYTTLFKDVLLPAIPEVKAELVEMLSARAEKYNTHGTIGAVKTFLTIDAPEAAQELITKKLEYRTKNNAHDNDLRDALTLIELLAGVEDSAVLKEWRNELREAGFENNSNGAPDRFGSSGSSVLGLDEAEQDEAKPPFVLEDLFDTELARTQLNKLLELPALPHDVASKVLSILAQGAGVLAPDKEAAKALIDKL